MWTRLGNGLDVVVEVGGWDGEDVPPNEMDVDHAQLMHKQPWERSRWRRYV